MRVEVSEYEKRYVFNLESITQLCGLNIVRKTYILESIRKYFSTYKYSEERNRWRDNVKIDNELVGRKFFTVLSIGGISDLLAMIKWSKQSLMVEYVKQLMLKYDLQQHLQIINEELKEIFQVLNEDIGDLGDVELSYAMSDVWEMVQKSNLTGSEQSMLEDKESGELILILLNLLEQVMQVNPRKMIVIMENLDHLVSRTEYVNILNRMQMVSMKYEVYFIVSTSLEGYVKFEKDICSGITVFGDEDVQMPEWEKISDFINDSYPCNKILAEEQIQMDLEHIVHRIGQQKFLNSLEEDVICKLINQTLMLNDRWENVESVPEIAFLKA